MSRSRLFYTRSGVVALWLWAFVFHTALLLLGAVLPDGWSFLVPHGLFWIASSTLACGAVGLVLSGWRRDRNVDCGYAEYVLDEGDGTLSFAIEHGTLGEDLSRLRWYPRPSFEARADRSATPGAATSTASTAGRWRVPYVIEDFVRLADVSRAEESDAGISLEVHAAFRRVRVPLEWAGLPRLRADLAAFEGVSNVASQCDAGKHLVLVLDEPAVSPGRCATGHVVDVRSDVYGYAALKRALRARLRIPIRGLRDESWQLGQMLGVVLAVAPLVGFAVIDDWLLRAWLVALFVLVLPVTLTAAYRHFGWMRGRWEMGLLLLFPLALLYLNAATSGP